MSFTVYTREELTLSRHGHSKVFAAYCIALSIHGLILLMPVSIEIPAPHPSEKTSSSRLNVRMVAQQSQTIRPSQKQPQKTQQAIKKQQERKKAETQSKPVTEKYPSQKTPKMDDNQQIKKALRAIEQTNHIIEQMVHDQKMTNSQIARFNQNKKDSKPQNVKTPKTIKTWYTLQGKHVQVGETCFSVNTDHNGEQLWTLPGRCKHIPSESEKMIEQIRQELRSIHTN